MKPKLSRQPELSGECGHYSIYHACALSGQPRKHDDIYDGHGRRYVASLTGISEDRIALALTYLKIKHHVVSTLRLKTACKYLDSFLEKGYPVIASVQDGAHWIVIAGKKGKSYITIDSNDSPIVQTASPELLKEWVGDDDFPLLTTKRCQIVAYCSLGDTKHP